MAGSPADESDEYRKSRSALPNSAAEAYRSRGFMAMAFMRMASRSRGKLRSNWLGSGMRPSLTLRSASKSDAAENRRRPVRSSYSTIPRENTSLVTLRGSAFACSGDMYANFPLSDWTTLPSSARFAMPKSVSFTSPANDRSTFDGDTSRWMSPMGLPSGPGARCAWSRASHTSDPMWSASARGNRAYTCSIFS